jgi:uncharacterized membrane protein YgcG
MTPTKHPVARVLVGLGAAVFLGVAAAWGQTYSHARIVRLSFVEGNVTIQRADIADWAEAPVNTPMEEGFKLSTAESSFAEVEFENGSTVRLGQLSMLEFTQLALASDGSKINCLTLPNGYATFHAAPVGQDVYEVRTSNATLTPRGKALFRVDVDSSEERVEVFNGTVEVASSLGSWTLAKNSVLQLSPGTDQPDQLSEGITKDDWDKWVQERESRVEAAQNSASSGAYSNNGSDAFYGWSDLSYYGNWSYMPGFGYGWMPNVYAGWSPYSFGNWCWYPGFGYTWISGEPWGWLPYHYGGWTFVPGIGWVWFPGSFGAWSPGLVTWYMGPGWIGWMPRPLPAYGGKTNPCAVGQPCGTAISTRAFQTGRPVRRGTILPVNLGSGKKVEQPGILPERQAMLPGRVVPQPAGFAQIEPILKSTRGATLGSQTINREPTNPAPGAVAGSSGAVGRPAVGSFTQQAAPGPRSGIVYDPASGLYVNGPRTPSAATPATNDLSIGSLPLPPVASGLRAVEPSSETPPKVGPTAAPQSHTWGWFHHSSPRSDSGSAAAPRSGGAAAGGHATSSSSRASGASSGSGSRGGGGMGGGSHGGGGSSSGGGHR